jgi:hypothetical protein
MTVMVERRRRGRPSVSPGESSVPLSFRVSESVYDCLTRLAAREQLDLALFARRALTELCNEKSTTPQT